MLAVNNCTRLKSTIFLQVKSHKSSIKFGKCAKLFPSFVGPFEVVERKGLVAYQLALPDSLRHMRDVFHVSICDIIFQIRHMLLT